MAKKARPDTSGEVPEWVVTYGDLMSLLLCFFILLAAFSELKQEREYREVLEQIQEAFGFRGGLGVNDALSKANNSSVSLLEERAKRSNDKMETNIHWESNVVGRHERVTVVQEGQRFAVGATMFFDEADATLSSTVREELRTQVAPRIRGQQFVVRIIGHAWGEGELASGFTYDELGYKRAQAVKDFLVRECSVEPMTLRVESAGTTEPASLGTSSVEIPPGNRRVQVWMTGRTVADTHPDPNYTGVLP
ncbi:MAG: MotB [Phycisphaeraceae bacterium]|nr:MAG: MotB [Phycisphaeraceae bacterium]